MAKETGYQSVADQEALIAAQSRQIEQLEK